MPNEQTTSANGYSEQDGEEKKKKRYVLLLLLLLLSGGALTWALFDRGLKNDEIEKLSQNSATLQNSYNSIQANYEAVMSQMDSMVSENYSLQQLLFDKRKEITQLNARMKSLVANFQNEQTASQAEMDKLADKINSLSLALQIARLQKDSLSNLASRTSYIYDTIYIRDTVSLANRAEVSAETMSSALSIKKLTAIPAAFNNKKQASAIDLEMTLEKENAKNVRPEQLLLVVKNAALQVLKSTNAQSASTINKAGPQDYSGIIYTRADTVKLSTVTYRFTPAQPITAGQYLVELYHNGKKIGDAKATVRSTERPYPF